MYQLGADGMPRRVVDYAQHPEWEALNLVSTAGAFLLAVGLLPFLFAVVRALRQLPSATGDPWGANSLEWATTSPPPHHNFRWLPPIRSERPVFDARVAALPGGGTRPNERPNARPQAPGIQAGGR